MEITYTSALHPAHLPLTEQGTSGMEGLLTASIRRTALGDRLRMQLGSYTSILTALSLPYCIAFACSHNIFIAVYIVKMDLCPHWVMVLSASCHF